MSLEAPPLNHSSQPRKVRELPIVQTVLLTTWVFLMSGCASVQGPQSDSGSWSQVSPPPAVVDPNPALAPGAAPNALHRPALRPGASSTASQGALAPLTAAQASTLSVEPLSAPADLWDRIRRGFAMPNLDTDLVRDREQYYATRPDYIGRMTQRSSKYLYHIVEELERRNMPTELALLPFIESAFNPQAISSAKAVGMWQFMPATGRHFDLKQNAFRDDRRDVLASTRAALDYLQKLYGMFGDWHLALAAYNWGEGSVSRAIAKNQRAGLGTAYTDLTMPQETRQYVPKFQAVKNIVAEPARFKASLPDIPNHPFFQSVTITRDIDVDLAAKLAEVDLADFKALNPSANRPVILAAAKPQILLPWDQAAVFQQNLDNHKGPRLASWTAWIAPTHLSTTEAAKRVGMSDSELRSVNNIPPRQTIQAGSTLVVPRGAKVEHDVAESVAENGQLGLQSAQDTRRKVVKLRQAETVASAARRYGVSASALAAWNKLGPQATLAKGQQLVLHVPVHKGGSKATGTRLAKAPAKSRTSTKAVRVAKR